MTIKLIIAAISLLTVLAGIVKYYLKWKKDNEQLDVQKAFNRSLVQHNKQVRLSIKEAEKRGEDWKEITEKALAGDLSDDDVNRLLSGKKPRG